MQPLENRPLVEMRGATRRFGDFTAVDGVSLDVPAGTILGVIGPSGSGKTTMIRMLNGTLEPTSGSVTVMGENPRRFRQRTRERIGYMPQHFVLYEDLTTSENVFFVASLFGLLWRRRSRRVREVLDLVELWDVRDRKARQLSGGMQRRLELACALVYEPTLLFVDEPTAGIDPVLRQRIWTEFRRLRDEGRTLMVTTQYVGEAEYCDQVALLAEGKLVAYNHPEKLRRQALGGEMIEISTARAVDSSLLEGVPGVIEIRQQHPRKLVVVAENAGEATPKILQALTRQGVEVSSSSEYRPSFDEVFTELLDQHNGTTEDRQDFKQDA